MEQTGRKEIAGLAKHPVSQDILCHSQRLYYFMNCPKEKFFIAGNIHKTRVDWLGQIPCADTLSCSGVHKLDPLSHADVPAHGLQLTRRARRRGGGAILAEFAAE